MRDVQVTKEQAITKFQNLTKELGRMPTFRQYEKHGHAMSVLIRLFGKPGWWNFLEAMGIKTMTRRSTIMSNSNVSNSNVDLYIK